MIKKFYVFGVVLSTLVLQGCIENVFAPENNTNIWGDTTTTSPPLPTSSLIDSIGITPTSTTVKIGQGCALPWSAQFTASVWPSTVDQSGSWEINRPLVATIDQGGKVTALTKGEAMVTFRSSKDSTKIKNATLFVTDESCGTPQGVVRTIEFAPQGGSGAVGTTLQLVATCRENGVIVYSCQPHWSSTDVTVILVDVNSGRLTFVNPGSAQIWVQWSRHDTAPKSLQYTFTATGG